MRALSADPTRGTPPWARALRALALGALRSRTFARRALVVVAAALVAGCAGSPGFVPPGILYVPTPEAVGVEMLRLAGVTDADVVYDLGSGDGRVVVAAAQQFGARSVGVEIEARLVQDSRERAMRTGVADHATFVWGDLFATNLAPATVVTLYLGENLNRRLLPKLLGELRPGARVVSHDFGMGDWTPDRTVLARGPDRDHLLQLWVIPADVSGTWRVRIDGTDGAQESTLVLHQQFQVVDGNLGADGSAERVTGTVQGDTIRLEGSSLALVGQLRDHRLEGAVTAADGTRRRWTGERR